MYPFGCELNQGQRIAEWLALPIRMQEARVRFASRWRPWQRCSFYEFILRHKYAFVCCLVCINYVSKPVARANPCVVLRCAKACMPQLFLYVLLYTFHWAFADRRGYLIMSLSRIATWRTWSLQLSEINNIMYAVKTLTENEHYILSRVFLFLNIFLRRVCTNFLETSPHNVGSSSIENFPFTFTERTKHHFCYFFGQRNNVLQYHSIVGRNCTILKQQRITLMLTRYVYQTW